MPENLYFREPKTQAMLLDILFIFCKLNRDVGYRQGMHELLAPVLWVVERDAINTSTSAGSLNDPVGESLMEQTLNSTYIEHDTFTLFTVLMRSAKSFYELGREIPEQSNLHSGLGSTTASTSAIVSRSQHIHDHLLASVDPQLAAWLKEIEVLPQVFLM